MLHARRFHRPRKGSERRRETCLPEAVGEHLAGADCGRGKSQTGLLRTFRLHRSSSGWPRRGSVLLDSDTQSQAGQGGQARGRVPVVTSGSRPGTVRAPLYSVLGRVVEEEQIA